VLRLKVCEYLVGPVAVFAAAYIGLLWLNGRQVGQFAPLPAALRLPHVCPGPVAAEFKRFPGRTEPLRSLPKFDPKHPNFSVDLRSRDASALDLRASASDLEHADFDSVTKWPPQKRMPCAYDVSSVMKLGKNPGLGIRSLHNSGITGRGVAIAIIDQSLLTQHEEYARQLQWYEQLGDSNGACCSMHGPAVASIAVGRTVGVAPDADLFYVAFEPRSVAILLGGYALCLRRLLEIDARLPKARKIRAISMSIGYGEETPGYPEFTAAVHEAEAQGIFVTWCGSREFPVRGLSVSSSGNREDFGAYGLPEWMQKSDLQWGTGLYVPMDARTTASPTGPNDYAHYGAGGFSWTVPYMAGAYALAAQVDPDIAPKRFWSLAMKTGRTIQVTVRGRPHALGPILDMPALIRALRVEKR